MINLRDEEKKFVYKKCVGIIKKDDEDYYFKESYEGGVELVASELANLVNINCINYEIVKIKNRYYYFSKALPKEKFCTFEKLHIPVKNLYSIWNELEVSFPQYKDKLMHQLIKIYLFDILLLNPDRNEGNIGLYYDKDDINLIILDNERSFYGVGKSNISSKFDKKDKLKDGHMFIAPGIPSIANFLNELEYFIKTSSDEYIEMLNNLLDILTPEVVMNTFELVESKNNIELPMKDEYIRRYEINYYYVKELLSISRTR